MRVLSLVSTVLVVAQAAFAAPINSLAARNIVTLYHATPTKFVESIKAKIDLTKAAGRTDFNREPHAFYLTPDERAVKEVMAEEVGGFTNEPTSIMTFTLDTTGLKVHEFSHETSGAKLDGWRAHVQYCRQPETKAKPLPPKPATVSAGYDVIIGWMSTIKQKQYEPIDTRIWQYAVLTAEGASKLKFVKAEPSK